MEQYIEAYKSVVKNFAKFDGRARRQEFWSFVLVNFIIMVLLGIISNVIGTNILSNVYSLFYFVISIAVSVRRFHDIEKSGWLLLIGLIPLVGWVLVIYWSALEGVTGENKYGADPKQSGKVEEA